MIGQYLVDGQDPVVGARGVGDHEPGVGGEGDVPAAQNDGMHLPPDPGHDSLPPALHCAGQLGGLALNSFNREQGLDI